MEIGIKSTIEMLELHSIKPSKSLGQNFLTDPNIPKKIVKSAGFDSSAAVLEIGPGLGALTMQLSAVAGHVTAVELDKRLAKILDEMFIGHSNVDIVQGDVLKLDVHRLLENNQDSFEWHVCANLPYNITTPVIAYLLETGLFKSLTFMIQKEVAERICARAGSPEYGAFTVFANYYSAPEMLFDVASESFYPRPKVLSTVLRLKTAPKRRLGASEEKIFFKVVRAAFGQRRKTLVNALNSVFGNIYSKEDIISFVSECGFDVRIRGEKLSIEDFIALSKHFAKS